MSLFSKTEYDARFEIMSALADQASGLTLPLFSRGMTVDNKASGADFDPVTNADRDAEAALRASILGAFERDAIVGEEFPDTDGESGWGWTLDPIDGTRAFVAGVPVWSTLIALTWDGDPVAGMIDLPALSQRFIGSAQGSYHIQNGKRAALKTQPCADLRDVVLGCTEPLAMFTQGERAAYEMIRRTAKFSRLGLDAFAYGLLASGRMDMVIEAGLKPCDVAALIPVVEGAGGRLTGWHGEKPLAGGRIIAVGDPAMLSEAYPYLRRAIDTKL